MPTDTRLLYILSELAYVAKLIPAKKAHDFVLSDFRQINGSFLDENLLLEANLTKLFSKLEAGGYKLILPDFLFTTTIINIELSDEQAVQEHLSKKLLPELGINDEDYYIETTVLSNYKGAFKVQLTALEKSVVAPLSSVLREHKGVKIESISPLSWTTKSIISLEPSVAILQMGDHLFLAQHYIGLDQCYAVEVAEAINFAETVKTLKGAEPSLQTVYLLTNALVDDAIKEKLKETLPVQQLADLASENEKMPSYVRQIIESGAKTFSIPEFLLPQFPLDKNYQVKEKTAETVTDASVEDDDQSAPLIKPAVIGGMASQAVASVAVPETAKTEVMVESLNDVDEIVEEQAEPEAKLESEPKLQLDQVKSSQAEPNIELPAVLAPPKPTIRTQPIAELIANAKKEIDFSQFANLALDPVVSNKNTESAPVSSEQKKQITDKKGEMNQANLPEKKIIKNPNDGASVSKMIFIGFLSFALTIALGIGIGLAYLNFGNAQTGVKPTVEVQPTVTPVATATVVVTPTPTPISTVSASLNKANYKILVVNATTKAGYASTIVNKLKTASFKDVSGKNAKGVYEAGDYLLVKEDTTANQALLKELEKATALDLVLQTDIAKEASGSSYSAVIVLGK